MRKTFLAPLFLAALCGCQSATMREAGDNSLKGGTIGGSAALGAVMGGPVGALVGGVLAYFGIELAEVEVERNEAEGALEAALGGLADREASARAAGAQQASDNANASLATMLNNPELAKMFQAEAAAATVPIQVELDRLGAEFRAKIWGWVWKVALILSALVVLIGGYWWSNRKEKKEFVRREDLDVPPRDG